MLESQSLPHKLLIFLQFILKQHELFATSNFIQVVMTFSGSHPSHHAASHKVPTRKCQFLIESGSLFASFDGSISSLALPAGDL